MISKYQFNKLYPKSWKDNNFYQKKTWKDQKIDWRKWRSIQADLAVNYFIQNNDSQKTVSDRFGISPNAFASAWRYFKSSLHG